MKGPRQKRIRSQIMSAYAGQMSEMRCTVSLQCLRYLQKDASPQKKGQMQYWSITTDVYQNHPAFFNAGACVITTLLFIVQYIPTLSFLISEKLMTPLCRGMTSPARDHVNLGNCHVPRDTYFMAFQAHETWMLTAKVKFNTVSASASSAHRGYRVK